MLTKLAIWYLKKRKKSVVLNMELNGGSVRSLTKTTYIDNNISNRARFFTVDHIEYQLTPGKLRLRLKKEEAA